MAVGPSPILLDLELISENDVLQKLKSVDDMEIRHPYRNRIGSQRYSDRVRKALTAIPSKYHDAALALFSAVLYVPSRVMRGSWRHIWGEIQESLGSDIGVNHIHLFSQDEESFASEFMRENRIEGRLDSDKYSRIGQIDDLADVVIDRFRGKDVDAAYLHDVALLRSKKVWILLNDKVISGHSATSELRRIIDLAHWLPDKPKVILATQMITERALADLRGVLPASDIYFGFAISDRMRVNHAESSLWKQHRPAIEELTSWFSERFILPNPQIYGRMLEKSKDRLEFGYRGCGLLYCDEVNCPTGSLPLIWHSCPNYTGPFPRVHSRVGDGSAGIRQNSHKWDTLSQALKEKSYGELF